MNKQKQDQNRQPAITVKDLPKCEYCGRAFIPTGPQQKFCSDAHRVAAFREKERKAARE